MTRHQRVDTISNNAIGDKPRFLSRIKSVVCPRLSYLAGCLFLAVIGLAHAEKPREWRFLLEGEYHGDEAPTQPGKGWLALTVTDGRWHLMPTDIQATRIHDAAVDADDQTTGIRISSEHPKALALLRGHNLRAGNVDTPNMRFTDNAQSISWAQPLDIVFKGQPYQIAVTRSKIYLKKGKQRTKLPELTVSKNQDSDFSESASLLWAGDLDGDGALDLIIGYGGYNRSGACLFLSSMAPSGRLVKPFACHGGVGC